MNDARRLEKEYRCTGCGELYTRCSCEHPAAQQVPERPPKPAKTVARL